MPAADKMDVSATCDVTYTITSTACAENATIKHDASRCTSDCSTFNCGFNSSSECLVQSNNSYVLSEGLHSDSLCSSVHHGALTVTAPYCWNDNHGPVTTCARSVLCLESTGSSTDNILYSHPLSSVTAEAGNSSSAMNGIAVFSHIFVNAA